MAMALSIIGAIDLARQNIQNLSSIIGILNTKDTQELLDSVDNVPNQPASLVLLFDTLADVYRFASSEELLTPNQLSNLHNDLHVIRLSIVNYLAERI